MKCEKFEVLTSKRRNEIIAKHCETLKIEGVLTDEEMEILQSTDDYTLLDYANEYGY